MNNLVEVCLVGLGVGVNYARWLVLLYHLYFFCNTVSILQHLRYSFVLNCRDGVEQNAPGGNCQDFLKWIGVFRSF